MLRLSVWYAVNPKWLLPTLYEVYHEIRLSRKGSGQECHSKSNDPLHQVLVWSCYKSYELIFSHAGTRPLRCCWMQCSEILNICDKSKLNMCLSLPVQEVAGIFSSPKRTLCSCVYFSHAHISRCLSVLK